VCRYANQNFSGAMARSAKMTIVEAEEIVPVGTFDPNHVHLPGVLYVIPPRSSRIYSTDEVWANLQREPSCSIDDCEEGRS